MSADAKGYYATLELSPGASIQAVRSAYRTLAKECHPDRPSCRDGGHQFRTIKQAYEFLTNETLKATYDNEKETPSPSPPPPPARVKPVACQVCGKVAAQPRHLAFWRVTSFLLATHKQPVQKIFCRKCASKEQWKSTLWTSLMGWWGFPWGPVWASAYGFTNAVGGGRERDADEALMFQNAVAFTAQGEAALAVGLSNILRNSNDPKVGQTASEIIRFFSERGFDPATTLDDPWKRSIASRAALFLTAFAVPALAAALIVYPWEKGSYSAPQSSPSTDPLAGTFGPPAQATEQTSPAAPASPTALPEATCDSLPSNGEVLVDHRASDSAGHKLEIDNGTSGDAIIKVRSLDGASLASFFVARGQAATLTKIPDGSYTIQYATGDKLAKGCRRFVHDGSASADQFPGPDTFETRYEDEFDGRSAIHQKLTYTLYPVPGGTVRPSSINMNEFEKP